MVAWEWLIDLIGLRAHSNSQVNSSTSCIVTRLNGAPIHMFPVTLFVGAVDEP
jgi:hypothetical protein